MGFAPPAGGTCFSRGPRCLIEFPWYSRQGLIGALSQRGLRLGSGGVEATLEGAAPLVVEAGDRESCPRSFCAENYISRRCDITLLQSLPNVYLVVREVIPQGP